MLPKLFLAWSEKSFTGSFAFVACVRCVIWKLVFQNEKHKTFSWFGCAFKIFSWNFYRFSEIFWQWKLLIAESVGLKMFWILWMFFMCRNLRYFCSLSICFSSRSKVKKKHETFIHAISWRIHCTSEMSTLKA